MEDFELKHGLKVIDKGDGQVLEIYEWDGYWYLASAKSLWNINQFNPEDFEVYKGDKYVGEYDKDYLSNININIKYYPLKDKIEKEPYYVEYLVDDGRTKKHMSFNIMFWSKPDVEKYLKEKYKSYEFVRIHEDYSKYSK